MIPGFGGTGLPAIITTTGQPQVEAGVNFAYWGRVSHGQWPCLQIDYVLHIVTKKSLLELLFVGIPEFQTPQ